MKILHTADLQLGRAYSRFELEDAALIAEERFKVVERIAALATRLQVDVILVAGDVFDSQTLKERSIRRFFDSLKGYSGRWILLPGNHDAALAESVWTQAQRFGVIPAHVHLALKPEVVLFDREKCAVLTAPLTQRQTFTDLTAWFDQAETPEGYLRVGLAHGSVQGILADSVGSSNPITQNRAQQARLDYLALGDWHGMKCINAQTWYSGTPEPDRFKGNQTGVVLEIDIDAAGALPHVTPHEVGHFRWSSWDESLVLASDLDALEQRLGALEARDVIELTLTGQVDLACHQRLSTMLAAAQARTRSFQVDRSQLRMMPTDEDMAHLQADGYLGEVLQVLRAGQGDAPAGVQAEALSILAGMMLERVAQGGEA